MADEKVSPVAELGRQPDVTPPEHALAPPPSFALYAALLVAAILMIGAAFLLGGADVPGLLSNVATEIVGAVVILILVDRRFRADEVQLLQRLPRSTRHIVAEWFARDTKHVLRYAHVISTRINLGAHLFYLSRPATEADMIANSIRGFVLLAPSGAGKTTLLHYLTRHHALATITSPTKAQVPVLVPLRRWGTGNEVTSVIKEEMRRYYRLPDRTFNRLLTGGRLICIFDGLDELFDARETSIALENFHHRYPDLSIIVSTRPVGSDAQLLPNLPRLTIPPLSLDETKSLLELRARFYDMPMGS